MLDFLFKKKIQKETTCNEEINILDIRNNSIYTKDDFVISILKINSINMQLFSKKELQQKVKDITTELFSEIKEFKFFSISRPVDVSSLIDSLMEKQNNSENQKQKNLLKKNRSETIKLTLTGDVVERQNFIIIYEKMDENAEKDLQKRGMELTQKFENCDIVVEVLDDPYLIQLCNSFTNMNFAFKEDADYEDYLPVVKEAFE